MVNHWSPLTHTSYSKTTIRPASSNTDESESKPSRVTKGIFMPDALHAASLPISGLGDRLKNAGLRTLRLGYKTVFNEVLFILLYCMEIVIILTVTGVVEVGHCLRDDVVDVTGTDSRVVASRTSIARQVVDRLPRALYRVDDSLLQIRPNATQALSQLWTRAQKPACHS